MNKWYQDCLNYNNSVKEYQTALSHAGFSEEAALNAIHKAFQYYYDKNFEPDPDYIIRMDRFLYVLHEHKDDPESVFWHIWLKYFVTMGGNEWNQFCREI